MDLTQQFVLTEPNMKTIAHLFFQLLTMKISQEQLARVLRPNVLELSSMFRKHDYELRAAGGAVRDLLTGLTPHDIDFATTATPEQMKKMFQEEGVRMINETGEKHGTITARIGEENFECTTLRIDVTTDGRHAEVQFTKDWYLDANRRDLTINSMFMDMEGTVYDYFDGHKHLEDRRVEFVGDSDTRIQEDYLRILRYFRFYGRIAVEPNAHSSEVLKSIARNSDGLSMISGERIWTELQKIAVGTYGGQLLARMIECKLGPHIGLPQNYDGEACAQLFARCSTTGIDPHALQAMTVMAAGFSNVDDAYEFIARIKCSRKDRELLVFILENRDAMLASKSLKIAQDLLADLVIDQKMHRDLSLARVKELLLYTCSTQVLQELERWRVPDFPIQGGVLADKLDDKRKTKAVTQVLYDKWKKSGFAMTSEDLLKFVDEIQSKIDLPSKKKKVKR